jgi:hypothetical protein
MYLCMYVCMYVCMMAIISNAKRYTERISRSREIINIYRIVFGKDERKNHLGLDVQF